MHLSLPRFKPTSCSELSERSTCLKDVLTTLPERCIIGMVLEREDPVDLLVMKKGAQWKMLDDLPIGSVVGMSSVRRVAQLKRRYPGLKFLDVVSPL